MSPLLSFNLRASHTVRGLAVMPLICTSLEHATVNLQPVPSCPFMHPVASQQGVRHGFFLQLSVAHISQNKGEARLQKVSQVKQGLPMKLQSS